MKIEKLSDNQIRCTLTRIDLSARQMDLQELTYGSENARNLFREMIQQASTELDFHVEDIPLMVEAIPVSNEGVVLLITKIEDPEELDTRFSKFTPTAEDTAFDGYDYFNFAKEAKEGIDDVIDSFKSMQEEKSSTPKAKAPFKDAEEDSKEETTEPYDVNQVNLVRVFAFPDLDTISNVASVLKNIYVGDNTLYKHENESSYYLVVNKPPHSPLEFNRICNILSEYGTKAKNIYATEAYFEEHFTTIIKKTALQILADL